jgi:hypothetical protein
MVKADVVIPASMEDERQCFGPICSVGLAQLYFNNYLFVPQLLYHYINLYQYESIAELNEYKDKKVYLYDEYKSKD